MSKLIGDVTSKVRSIKFYSDEYENTPYNYAVLEFTRKSGAPYFVRLKGLKDDSVVIVEDLTVEQSESNKKKIDVTSDQDDDDDDFLKDL